MKAIKKQQLAEGAGVTVRTLLFYLFLYRALFCA